MSQGFAPNKETAKAGQTKPPLCAATDAASQQPLLASASVDKTIKLWTLDGALVTTLDRHTAKVQEVVFSPDSRFLFSASGDNTVIRWDLDAILQLDPLDYACAWVHDYLKTSPTLSPEDRQLCE